MRKYKTVAMIALTLSIVGGVFALPSFASADSGEYDLMLTDNWDYPDTVSGAHNFVIVTPQTMLKPNVIDKYPHANLVSDYHHVNAWLDTISSKDYSYLGISDGTPVTYHFEFDKQQWTYQGEMMQYLSVSFWIEGYENQTMTHIDIAPLRTGQLPIGYTTRAKSALTYFYYEGETQDSYGYYREWNGSLTFTCEMGKECCHTIYFYAPDSAWKMYEDYDYSDTPLADNVIDSVLGEFGTAYDNIQLSDLASDADLTGLISALYDVLTWGFYGVPIMSAAILAFILYGRRA